MLKKLSYLCPLLILLLSLNLKAQSCSPDSLETREIRAKDTDSRISFELQKHFVYYNPSCISKNTLLLHLVGTSDNTNSTKLFPSLAANHGFHAIVLKYPNNNGSARTNCGNSSDSNCYLNFRKETIEGVDYSTDINVDNVDCINNRLEKLLTHLNKQYPKENWEQYLNGTQFNWSKIIISGHSQGGGQGKQGYGP